MISRYENGFSLKSNKSTSSPTVCPVADLNSWLIGGSPLLKYHSKFRGLIGGIRGLISRTNTEKNSPPVKCLLCSRSLEPGIWMRVSSKFEKPLQTALNRDTRVGAWIGGFVSV
jgi:hypothetical protein